jgi:thioredoxin 1
MLSRRLMLFSSLAAASLAAPAPAQAFEFKPYDGEEAQIAIKSGKPVVLHVYASWCLQCHAQKSILSDLESDPKYDRVRFFRVDYDGQKDVVAQLGCPRSTLIVYKGGKEVARMSWGISQSEVVTALQAAL